MPSTLPSITRATAKRAVHLRITPRPSNIGESREIMRLVSQFGEVEYFKSLKYDTLSAPNTAIVIFREEEAAQHCLRKDPIRFRMGRAPMRPQQRAPQEEQQQQQQERQPQKTQPIEEQNTQFTPSSTRSRSPQSNSPWGVSAPSRTQQTRALSTGRSSSTLPKPSPQPLDLPGFSPRAQAPGPESRIFEIRANPARVSFRDQLNTSHFHGHFAYDTQSIAQQDLLKRVPIPGLSDVNWRAEGKLWKNVEREREQHAAFRGSGKRKSLIAIYEEGKKEGGGGDDDDGGRDRGGRGRQRDALSPAWFDHD